MTEFFVAVTENAKIFTGTMVMLAWIFFLLAMFLHLVLQQVAVVLVAKRDPVDKLKKILSEDERRDTSA